MDAELILGRTVRFTCVVIGVFATLVAFAGNTHGITVAFGCFILAYVSAIHDKLSDTNLPP